MVGLKTSKPTNAPMGKTSNAELREKREKVISLFKLIIWKIASWAMPSTVRAAQLMDAAKAANYMNRQMAADQGLLTCEVCPTRFGLVKVELGKDSFNYYCPPHHKLIVESARRFVTK
jgi:hypothetical protein